MEKLKVSMDAKAVVRLSKIFPKIIKDQSLNLSAKDVENIGKLIQAAKKMRENQELFERTRSDQAFRNKKRLEAVFDKNLDELIPLTKKETPNQGGLF